MNSPGIQLNREIFSPTINGVETRVPIIHAQPETPTDLDPVIFASGFGNLERASEETARNLSQIWGRPVIIAVSQEAHCTLKYPKTQLTGTYSIVNQTAKDYAANKFGKAVKPTIAGLSHGAVPSTIFVHDHGPHDLLLMNPMGGNLADIHTQEVLDELAHIDNFDSRWQQSMEEASSSARWQLLAKFLIASAKETLEMSKDREFQNMTISGLGIFKEFILNARFSDDPNSQALNRNGLVVMDAFHAGATADYRSEIAEIANSGNKVLVVCGEKDPMYGIETVKKTVYSHPEISENEPNIRIIEVQKVIHPYPTRSKPVGSMASEASWIFGQN